VPTFTKMIWLVGWDERSVVRVETMAPAVQVSFGLSFEDRHLLIRVMRMPRHLGSDGKVSQPGRHVRRTDLFRNQGDRLDAIAPVYHRQRIGSQNMRFCLAYFLSEFGHVAHTNSEINGRVKPSGAVV
jgi:hypothetical protein